MLDRRDILTWCRLWLWFMAVVIVPALVLFESDGVAWLARIVAVLVCWSWLYGMDLAVGWVERRVVKGRE